MGNLLEAPITTKDGHFVEVNTLKVGVAGMQGWRVEMEDAHIACPLGPEDHSLVAIFDGHGGQFAAQFSAENIANRLRQTESWRKYLENLSDVAELGNALQQTYLDLDEEMRSRTEVERSGCTAVAAVISRDFIVVANAGDSRCVLGTGGETKPMSQDHKPFLDSERLRIERAGGKVSWKRVDGDLAVSRALGDFYYKNRDDMPPQEQKVTAWPEVSVHARTAEDELLLLACDGVWDVMSNEEAIETAREILLQGERNIQLVAEELIDICLEKGSRDNISAAIVALPGARYGEGEGVWGRRKARGKKQADARRDNLMGQELPEDSHPEATNGNDASNGDDS